MKAIVSNEDILNWMIPDEEGRKEYDEDDFDFSDD